MKGIVPLGPRTLRLTTCHKGRTTQTCQVKSRMKRKVETVG